MQQHNYVTIQKSFPLQYQVTEDHSQQNHTAISLNIFWLLTDKNSPKEYI